MHKWNKLWLLVISLLTSILSFAQDSSDANKNAGFMRSEGKIYVVMTVAIVILTGLILYIVRLDRKLSNLEKGNKD